MVGHGVKRAAIDLASDAMIPTPLGVRKTPRYVAAAQVLKQNRGIKRTVGHSLGGAISYNLSKDNNLEYETYAAPALNLFGEPDRHRHRHYLDPVSVTDRGATSSFAMYPHGYL